MHDRRELVEERISREVFERVLPLVHPAVEALAIEAGPAPAAMSPFAAGSPWGTPWATTWFRLSGVVPAEWATAGLHASGRDVVAVVDLGFDLDMPGFQCEGLVRLDDGTPVVGVHPRRTNIPVSAAAGEPVTILLEAASNPTFPQFQASQQGRLASAAAEPLYVFHRADLVIVDREAEALLIDIDVLDGVMRTLPVGDRRRQRLLATLERAFDAIAHDGAAGVAPARSILAQALAWRPAESTHRIVATGHAHIDSAWLWPTRETERKCLRTFTSAVAQMDADPDYVFSCSQAQQYEWVREAEPAVFERIKRHVAGGQWVPVGGMWVESDMNLPSGESIARQIVHGQRYFEEHFGLRCTEMWIPDVFGYPAGLPQVFAAGGMRRFVTQKLSWNRTNRFPHHTFWWEGLDGTRVLTHFPPVDTYNAEITPAELAHAVDNFAEHAWSDWSLVPFGHGDGGGGPTPLMMERLRRMAELDGMPRLQAGSAAEFFAHVEAEAAAGAPVPVWRGELYFETHRGTLTSQLRTKLGNRRCEKLLREVELLAATASAAGATVDPDELTTSWRDVLTQQFHDILPGSSIGWVHDDAEEVFARVAGELEAKAASWAGVLSPDAPLLVNAATRARREIVVAATAPAGDGPVQPLADGRVAYLAVAPALGVAPVLAPSLPADGFAPIVVTDRTMANEHVAIAWDPDGRLTSLIDVASARDALVAGHPAAVLELAVDHPVRYDAWDVEEWTVAQGVPLGAADRVDVEASGPLVGIVAVHYAFGPSTAVVRYVLRAGSARVDVDIDLDWHHSEHLLSMTFPLDVHTDTATCGVQFGSVRRPTHASTSWDAAKFEVCAHRWVDVSEPSFGVAVLNDGRYGHGLFDGGVRVSLARAARYPDPDADQGRHRVTLALLPHGAGLAGVVAEAERLDLPLRQLTPTSCTGIGPSTGENQYRNSGVVSVTGDGVEVDAVKVADDGSGDLVVRLHEAVGNRVRTTVAAVRRIVDAAACNLLEEPQRHFEVSDGIVALTLRPFELMTLRLTLAPAG